ncbi:MAG: indole-3-glycerol phosphate synthase TrpC [Chitinophagaceae bacterium]
MNILDTIIAAKQVEVQQAKTKVTIEHLQQLPWFYAPTYSLKQRLLQHNTTGIIAEFKRQSPSKGVINATAHLPQVIQAYQTDAAGISVLTDHDFFGGSLHDLATARSFTQVPLLRKDFIIDEYQIIEAKAYGASVILLIAACLSPARVAALAKFAQSLQLEVLLEVHNETELQHYCEAVDMVGVNNRNLKNFTINVEASIRLLNKLPKNIPVIAESGIDSVALLLSLKRSGFHGFLMGEYFMKQTQPAIAFADFVTELKATQHEN